MTVDVSLTDVIAGVIEKAPVGADLDAVTSEVFAVLGCPKKWSDLFFPLMRNEVGHTHRRASLAALRARYAGERVCSDGVESDGCQVDRSSFLAATVETGGPWGRVAFGAMTVEMHESRIAMQRRLQGGIQVDIDRHGDAIAEIVSAGATCLNDIYIDSEGEAA